MEFDDIERYLKVLSENIKRCLYYYTGVDTLGLDKFRLRSDISRALCELNYFVYKYLNEKED